MEILLVYGLILVFFLGLIPVLFLITKEKAMEIDTRQQHEKTRNSATKQASNPSNKAAYGLLGLIFAFMLLLTILTQRGQQ